MRDYRAKERRIAGYTEQKQERQIFGGGKEIKDLLYWILFLNIAIFGFMIGMFISYVFF